MDQYRKSGPTRDFIVENLLAALVAVCILLIAAMPPRDDPPPQPVVSAELPPAPQTVFPDFSLAENTGERKRVFLGFVQDYIVNENRLISLDRLRLLSLAETPPAEVAPAEAAWLDALAERYGAPEADFAGHEAWLAELLLRVDIVPTSLALAQAANESAWGTSRFAREGNNIFGEWCFTAGCGIVPRRRQAGASHEVRSFATLRESVEAYFLNINTNGNYGYFRELRHTMKAQRRELDPLVLAFGLNRYSQRGGNYVNELQLIIVQNGLAARDGQHSTMLGLLE